MGADSNERKSSILHLANILKKQGVKQELVEKIQEDMIGTFIVRHKADRFFVPTKVG